MDLQKAFHGFKLLLYQQITDQSFQAVANELFGSFYGEKSPLYQQITTQ